MCKFVQQYSFFWSSLPNVFIGGAPKCGNQFKKKKKVKNMRQQKILCEISTILYCGWDVVSKALMKIE